MFSSPELYLGGAITMVSVRRSVSVNLSLNDFFSETTGPRVIWFKFGHKHYWVKGLQILTNGEAPPP